MQDWVSSLEQMEVVAGTVQGFQMVQARVWSIAMAAPMTPDKLKVLQQEFPEWEFHLLPGGKIGAIPPKLADWSVLD